METTIGCARRCSHSRTSNASRPRPWLHPPVVLLTVALLLTDPLARMMFGHTVLPTDSQKMQGGVNRTMTTVLKIISTAFIFLIVIGMWVLRAAADVTVCNSFTYPIYVAVGYKTVSDLKTEGWWLIDSNACQLVDNRTVTGPYYIHAHTQWIHDANGLFSAMPGARSVNVSTTRTIDPHQHASQCPGYPPALGTNTLLAPGPRTWTIASAVALIAHGQRPPTSHATTSGPTGITKPDVAPVTPSIRSPTAAPSSGPSTMASCTMSMRSQQSKPHSSWLPLISRGLTRSEAQGAEGNYRGVAI